MDKERAGVSRLLGSCDSLVGLLGMPIWGHQGSGWHLECVSAQMLLVKCSHQAQVWI